LSAKPRLIVLSAPSGAGKTTLCDLLLAEFPNIALSISTTTRGRRPYEINSVHYDFVDNEHFQRMVKQGEFVEWARVHSHCYGTTKSRIEGLLRDGKHVLFDIDVQGAMSLRTIYGDQVLLIFIHPPSLETLKERLIARKGDSMTSIEKRLEEAYNEIRWSTKFQYQLTNDELQNTYSQLKSIILKECP